MTLEAAELPFEKDLFAEGDFTAESGYQAMQRILASGASPTALFAGNDTIAMGALLALRQAGLSVPQDFAVVGYDDLPIASYTCPPLTTIRTHPYEQGKLLAKAAIALMNKEKVGSQQDVLPLELIVRESCGARSDGKSSLPRRNSRATDSLSHRKPGDTPAVERKHPAVEL